MLGDDYTSEVDDIINDLCSGKKVEEFTIDDYFAYVPDVYELFSQNGAIKGEKQVSYATITDYDASCSHDVVIPRKLNDAANSIVVAIGARAFKSKDLNKLTLPRTLTYIDELAFYDNNLTTISIPSSVTYKDVTAFCNNPLSICTFTDSDYSETITAGDEIKFESENFYV